MNLAVLSEHKRVSARLQELLFGQFTSLLHSYPTLGQPLHYSHEVD